MNEKILAERLAAGDTNALGKIIEMYSGYVRTVAYNFSRGRLTPEDIDEVTSDVFFALWNSRGNLKAELGLRAYLSAAVRSKVINRFKKMPPQSEDISELELSSDIRVEDTAEINEMMTCLYECLETLSDNDREIFFRFYFYGERAAKIAELMAFSAGAVEKRLSRMRQKIRDYLIERGYDHA